jgi:segregation and condensation protein B
VTGFDEAIVDESVDRLDDNSVERHADEPAGPAGSPSESGESGLPVDSREEGESSESANESADQPVVALDLDDPARLTAAVEALLFVVESPITVAAIAAVLQRPVAAIETALSTIAASYDQPGRGVELRWVADGVRVYTRPELSEVVEAFLLDGQRARLSPAALETLAVIAYRQPVTRGRISAIRGVNVDGVVRTLASRGLIVEEGTEGESGAGLYRTTGLFLERMGLQSLEELPSLAPLLPEIDTLETDEL